MGYLPPNYHHLDHQSPLQSLHRTQNVNGTERVEKVQLNRSDCEESKASPFKVHMPPWDPLKPAREQRDSISTSRCVYLCVVDFE